MHAHFSPSVNPQNIINMKRNIKNTLYTGLAVVSSVAAMVSCTDTWDEHYDANILGSANGTLMQAIENNAPDFARVVKAVKFDKELSSDNSFTVWAPQHFNVDSVLELAAKDSADVVNGFVKNHIARYAYPMDGNANHVSLINNKFTTFTNQNFSTSNLVKTNISCENGILHVIDNGTPYLLNIFETIKEQYRQSDYSEKDSLGGSLYTFLRGYDADSLDRKRSVSRGYDQQGNQIWVDSVVIRNNTVLKNVDALIYEEDSNYIALLPTPEAYHKRFLEYKELFKFNERDEKESVRLQNHYANMFAMNDLFYNVNFNEHMEDSLKSTTYFSHDAKTGLYYRKDKKGQLKPTHDILDGLTPVKCSNGTAYFIDEYPMSAQEQCQYELRYTLSPALMAKSSDKKATPAGYTSNTNLQNSDLPRYTYSFADYQYKDTTFVDETTGNIVSGKTPDMDTYELKNVTYYVYPFISNVKTTELAFFIPNYLSGTYDISVVTVPYCNHEYLFEGKDDAMVNIKDEKTAFNAYLLERKDNGDYPNSKDSNSRLENVAESTGSKKSYDFYIDNKLAVDTIYLGEHTFKNTYYGRGTTENACGAMIQFSTKKKVNAIFATIILTPKANKKDE